MNFLYYMIMKLKYKFIFSFYFTIRSYDKYKNDVQIATAI
jgi:hypothetical protein